MIGANNGGDLVNKVSSLKQHRRGGMGVQHPPRGKGQQPGEDQEGFFLVLGLDGGKWGIWGKYCGCISREVSQFIRVMGTCSPLAPLHAFWGGITVIQSCVCYLLPLVLPAPPPCPWPPSGPGGKKI